ncbi:UDP-N-acetylmuramate--L-alanine ligase [Bienertia sinuspersici]
MLANKVGSFIKIDKNDDMDIERSVRIRVNIDILKPLKDEVKLKLRGGDISKIQLKYERLPMCCFICERIGHKDKDYDEFNGDHSPVKKLGT